MLNSSVMSWPNSERVGLCVTSRLVIPQVLLCFRDPSVWSGLRRASERQRRCHTPVVPAELEGDDMRTTWGPEAVGDTSSGELDMVCSTPVAGQPL